jgi:hypothetical protein
VNILVELRTAINTTVSQARVSKYDARVTEYVDGIEAFFSKEIPFQKNGADIYVSDNTVSELNPADHRFVESIPLGVSKSFFDKNHYGVRNKGAGLIEAWKHNAEKISGYDWILYFEPRLILKKTDFIESFLSNPRNLFTIGENKNSFNTGLFGISSKTLLEYSNSVNLDEMVENNISIEDDIYRFFKEKNIQYDTIEKMGAVWKDTYMNREFEF